MREFSSDHDRDILTSLASGPTPGPTTANTDLPGGLKASKMYREAETEAQRPLFEAVGDKPKNDGDFD